MRRGGAMQASTDPARAHRAFRVRSAAESFATFSDARRQAWYKECGPIGPPPYPADIHHAMHLRTPSNQWHIRGVSRWISRRGILQCANQPESEDVEDQRL